MWCSGICCTALGGPGTGRVGLQGLGFCFCEQAGLRLGASCMHAVGHAKATTNRGRCQTLQGRLPGHALPSRYVEALALQRQVSGQALLAALYSFHGGLFQDATYSRPDQPRRSALRHLARQGLPVPQDVLSRDLRQAWALHPGIQAVWEEIYRNPTAHWQAYELAEKLVDFEDYFRRWRFNHLTTVARVIGIKRGTGGTSGVSYLRRMLDVELFPELWALRTSL